MEHSTRAVTSAGRGRPVRSRVRPIPREESVRRIGGFVGGLTR
ncbi:hypothetical protein [Haladaptatus salinisoli]|nr:hypothetical protein [Haladaptatus salinisoli]